MQIQSTQNYNYNPQFKGILSHVKPKKAANISRYHQQNLLKSSKTANQDGGDFIKKSLNVVLGGGIGTFAGMLGSVFTNSTPLLMVGGLGAGLLFGAIPLIKFMLNSNNDIPEIIPSK